MSCNLILYGPPGTGKSHEAEILTRGKLKFQVTFHPSFDNSNFLGSYRPFSFKETTNFVTIYKFIPQAFLRAYVEAWKNLTQDVYFVIEEINRGNCSEIFAEIFQLLDRDEKQFSKYYVSIDSHIRDFLYTELIQSDYAPKLKDILILKNQNPPTDIFSILLLPSNLKIIATMNTSDQSLFPMDSAFKRRWDWRYVPINYEDADKFTITINSKKFSWKDFIWVINKKITLATDSEDKQIGNRFISTPNLQISSEIFKNKVLFYIWNEVCKSEDPQSNHYFFKYKNNQEQEIKFSFGDLFSNNEQEILIGFMKYLQINEK